jgi:hypothetical protein
MEQEKKSSKKNGPKNITKPGGKNTVFKAKKTLKPSVTTGLPRKSNEEIMKMTDKLVLKNSSIDYSMLKELQKQLTELKIRVSELERKIEEMSNR